MADEKASAGNETIGNVYVKLVTGKIYEIPFIGKDQVRFP